MRITAISNGIESSRDFYDDLRERLGTHEQLLQISLTPTKSPEKAIRCLGENLATVSSNMVLLSDHGDLRLTVHDIYGGKTTGLGTLSQQACRGAVRQGEQGVASLIHQAALSHQMSPSVNQKLSRGFYDALRANLETRDVLLQISLTPVSNPDARLQCWGEDLAEVIANMGQLQGQGPLKVGVRELHNGKDTELGEISEQDCEKALQQGVRGASDLLSQTVMGTLNPSARDSQFYNSLRETLETRDVLLQISVEPVSDPDKRLACWSENLAEVTANMRQLAHRGPLKVSVHELHNGKTTQLGELSEDDCLRATQRGPAGIGALITQAAQEWQRRVPAMDLD
jgi:hypothetical protein